MNSTSHNSIYLGFGRLKLIRVLLTVSYIILEKDCTQVFSSKTIVVIDYTSTVKTVGLWIGLLCTRMVAVHFKALTKKNHYKKKALMLPVVHSVFIRCVGKMSLVFSSELKVIQL